MKTSELTDAALDWAVGVADGVKVNVGFRNVTYVPKGKRSLYKYSPSTNWSQGGPIIERELIGVGYDQELGWVGIDADAYYQTGETPLIAAMRCYVASQLGDTVDVPEELTP